MNIKIWTRYSSSGFGFRICAELVSKLNIYIILHVNLSTFVKRRTEKSHTYMVTWFLQPDTLKFCCVNYLLVTPNLTKNFWLPFLVLTDNYWYS